MIRTLAASGAAGLASLTLVAPTGAPPSSEPPTETITEEPAGNVEFERNLAELAFALFLGNELDVNAGAYSCTEPSTLAVGEIITCFSLTGSDRVVVAITELSGTSGVYKFEVISDYVIPPSNSTSPDSQPDDSLPDSSPDSSPSGPTTTLPTPFIVTTSTPLTEADRELLGLAEQINEDADELVQTLVSGNDGVIESADYSWDGSSATVKLSATLSPTYTHGVDTAAWIIARDRAMALWSRQSPFRAEGTTIRPNLEVTVDDERFVSDFDLCVQLADQTIAMTDWLAESRAN